MRVKGVIKNFFLKLKSGNSNNISRSFTGAAVGSGGGGHFNVR